jgi:hypothetical protein
MKTFMSEFLTDYTTYTFGYTKYAIAESHSELDVIYGQGFLPYTGNLTLDQNIFYFCRSLRVDLASFEHNSENRRVLKRIEPLNIEVVIHDKSSFDFTNPEFEDFCIAYTHSRFYHEGMSTERFRYVMSRSYANKIFEFRSEGKVIGYTLAVVTETFMHHWFCFFETELMNDQIPLGKYLMQFTIDRSKKQWLQYAYLWTCYKETGLYKVRDFKGVEFWDGNVRSKDTELIRVLCRTDNETKYKDNFKNNPAYYLS